MTRVKLVSDLETRLKLMPEVQAAVLQAAGDVHMAAVRRASPHRDSGNYIRQLVIEDRHEFGAAVIAGAPYSNFVEYGTCSRRLPEAPTPCPHPEPKKTGIHPQLIMTGAIQDVTR